MSYLQITQITLIVIKRETCNSRKTFSHLPVNVSA